MNLIGTAAQQSTDKQQFPHSHAQILLFFPFPLPQATYSRILALTTPLRIVHFPNSTTVPRYYHQLPRVHDTSSRRFPPCSHSDPSGISLVRPHLQPPRNRQRPVLSVLEPYARATGKRSTFSTARRRRRRRPSARNNAYPHELFSQDRTNEGLFLVRVEGFSFG